MFVALSSVRLPSKVCKSADMSKNFLFNKVQKGISKNAEFDAYCGSVKMLSKNSREKVHLSLYHLFGEAQISFSP
jgi:hypothetical protein